MNSSFEIKPATSRDVPVILRLIHGLAEYERAADEVTTTEDQLHAVLFGENPAAQVLIGREGDNPVAFAIYFFNFSTWTGRRGLYLEDLFVVPEERGKGYGRKLLVRLADVAQRQGCGRMEWVVLDWNQPAIEFYRRLGAKPLDEWTVFGAAQRGNPRLAHSR